MGGDNDNDEVYEMKADGSNPTNLTKSPADDFEPAYSPDGKHIAFVTTRDNDEEVYKMNVDGSNPTNLTKNPAFDLDPAWQPNKKK